MTINGAKIIIECLKEQGVDTVFGFPGGAVLGIYDELYKQQEHIKHILTSHEQGASHAADGYARATGKTGVCIATSGPGASNTITGIATAYMDSTPMVVITGNVPSQWLGRDGFQEVDICGMTMPVTKHNFLVRNIEELADTIRKAFAIAIDGRPGPVLVDIPKDITVAMCEYKPKTGSRFMASKHRASEDDIKMAAEQINAAKRPFIYAGGGVVKSGASDSLLQFAEKVDAPVTCSLMGLSSFPSSHELFTGMVGMHGTKASNLGVTKCDLLIVLGARFSDRVVGKMEEFAPEAKVLQIDIDPAEVNKNIQTFHHLIGDVNTVLGQLLEHIQPVKHEEWVNQIKEWKEHFPSLDANDEWNGKKVIKTLSEIAPEGSIICTEVGQHQMWTAQYYNFSGKGKFITSGGLGTMGFGFGAAIGAQVGCPDRQVINVAGDGSFRMNLNELATIARYNISMIIVLMDNGVLGMVRQWQTMFYEERYSQTTLKDLTDYEKIAEGFGVKTFSAESIDQLKEVLREAIEMNAPVLVHCKIDSDEKVFPMVAPGKPINNIIVS